MKMKTHQGFFNYKSPQNLNIINSNYNNIYRYNGNYTNNYSTINKYNNNIIYNNENLNNKKSFDFNNNSNRRINTENNDKYFLKSQNYFNKNYNTINNFSQKKAKDYSASISVSKRPNKINNNFYYSNNNFYKRKDNIEINKRTTSTNLPSIQNGFQIRNTQSQKKPNTLYNYNKNFNYNNYKNNDLTVNNIKVINPVKINNNLQDINHNNINNNKSESKNKNTSNFLQIVSNSSPSLKNNLMKNTNFNQNYKKTNTSSFNNNNNLFSLNYLLKTKYSLYKDSKYSEKSFNLITAYGVNTYKGTVRNYNEDRISVVVNAKQNTYQKLKTDNSTKVSYFAIYDGHAGNKCCEFLKNFLHCYIFESPFFPDDPLKAIEEGFNNCEKKFIESIKIKNRTRNQMSSKSNLFTDFSGSCAIIIIIIDDTCYTINLGDSRALYSYNSGNKFYQLSRDHKPNDPIEKNRIYKAGGSIFRTNLAQYGIGVKESDLGFKIPFRILPGRLAVSKYLYTYFLF